MDKAHQQGSRAAQAEARAVAEEARQKAWFGESFLRELFLGKLRPEFLSADDDATEPPPRQEFEEFFDRLHQFLRVQVDPAEIDAHGEYPPHVLDGLAKLGAFGMKIETQYGGLGFTHREYVRVMQLVGSYDSNLTALLSAHQSIGVPHPVQMFGSEDLKRRYLPRCARGAISAFALTEPSVGSDPGKLATLAHPSADGSYFTIEGQKLWCTNGTIAELLVVLARNPETKAVSCFLVETDWPGVRVAHRSRFMGLKALANGVISFEGVRVPRENIVGKEGSGLKVALATLNTGRLTLPASSAGSAKFLLEVCRKWASARVQWGQPIGKHEAIAHMVADMAATTYAMQSVAEVVGALADRPDRDIRLEAAAAKEWNTVRGWELTDRALQIRGGRGYETEHSLEARGERPIGIERMLRDCRVNRIFEGSSEIMHLFIAREAVDRHLQVAGVLIDPKVSLGRKLLALPRIGWFYLFFYPRLWLGFVWARHGSFGELARHVRYADRSARRLARSVFHGMLRYGPGLERKQAFLFRAVDVALELMALMAAVMRAQRRHAAGRGDLVLVHHFAAGARRKIDGLLHAMWSNEDAALYGFAQEVLAGRYVWLEEGAVALPYDAAELVPPSMQEILAARAHEPSEEHVQGGNGRAALSH